MLLERLFEKRELIGTSLIDPPSWLLDLFGGQETTSGEKVSENNALIHPDVFSCVQILSDDVAKLPIQTFLKSKNTIRKVNHPITKLLYIKPNEYMTAFTWKKLMITHQSLYGNAYSYIKFDKNGDVVGLYPLHPSYTQPYIDPNSGMLWYQSMINNKTVELYPDEILHFKGLSNDGIIGKSPIQVLREHIGAQAAATKFNAKLYKNDATPRGILKVPTVLKPEAKNAARDEWRRVNSGEDIAVVDAGLDYQSVSMPLQDAQFVESMKFNKLQIASIFKVPPHKINELDRATFSNIEQQSLDYVKNTLQPLLTNFEQESIVKLYTDEEFDKGFYNKFNVNSELRGDSQARAEYYKTMTDIGVYSINQVLEKEDENKIDGGDVHRVDLNHISIDIADEYQLAKAKGQKGGDENGQGNPSNNDQN